MSHLYGFHPGDQISIDEQPEIFQAVRKTLDYRLDNGGAGTGWSRAWLINCSARLMDGEMAYKHIQLLFQNRCLKTFLMRTLLFRSMEILVLPRCGGNALTIA